MQYQIANLSMTKMYNFLCVTHFALLLIRVLLSLLSAAANAISWYISLQRSGTNIDVSRLPTLFARLMDAVRR